MPPYLPGSNASLLLRLKEPTSSLGPLLQCPTFKASSVSLGQRVSGGPRTHNLRIEESRPFSDTDEW